MSQIRLSPPVELEDLSMERRHSGNSERYLEFVPRVSSPLTLPPVSPEPKYCALLGCCEVCVNEGSDGCSCTRTVEERRSSYISLVLPLERLFTRSPSSANDRRGEAEEEERRNSTMVLERAVPIRRRSRVHELRDEEGESRRWDTGNSTISQVTLAQLLEEEIARDDREDEDEEDMDEEEEDEEVQQSRPQGRENTGMSRKQTGRSLRKANGLFVHSDDDNHGRESCLPCLKVDLLCGPWRHWRLKSKSKKRNSAPPALKELVNGPISPEQYHSYFLNLYLNENGAAPRPRE